MNMRYFKSFGNYINEYKDTWIGKDVAKGTASATGSLFSFVFKSFSVGFRKAKLRKIANEYSEYLDKVYKHYLKMQEEERRKEKEANLPKNQSLPIEPDPVVPIQEPEPEPNPFLKPISKQKPEPERIEQDERDFEDTDLDIEEIEGLMFHAKTSDELMRYIEELKKKEVKTTKEIDSLFQEIHNSDDPNYASTIEDKLEAKKARLNRIQKLLKIKPKNESIFETENWRANAVVPPSWWMDGDKVNVTNLVNPYKINEFILKKEGYCDIKNNDKLKKYWSLLENGVFKKWFYIFNIDSLRSTNKSVEMKSKTSDKDKKTALTKLDVISDKLQLTGEKITNVKGGNYYVVSLLSDNIHLVLYKVDVDQVNYNMYKVIGALDLADGSTENNMKFIIKKLGRVITIKKGTYNVNFDNDGYAVVRILMDSTEMNIFFDSTKENAAKNLRINEGYSFNKFESKRRAELLIDVSNLPQPINGIDQAKSKFLIK